MVFANHLRHLWWGFWLLEHLRIQQTIGLVGLAILLLLAKQRWLAIALLLPIAINLFYLAPRFQVRTPETVSPDLTITHLSTDRGAMESLTYLQSRQDDILFLQEVTPPYSRELFRLDGYRIVIVNGLWNTHGSAMLVRNDWAGEVISKEVIHLPASSDRPLLSAQILAHNQLIRLLSLHTIRPGVNPQRLTQHEAEYTAVTEWANQVILGGETLIIIGDFNATPWSTSVQNLLDVGLQDCGRGFGLQASWHAEMPAFTRIPIDLCYHSSQLRTISYSVGAYAGSDHLPLHVGFIQK